MKRIFASILAAGLLLTGCAAPNAAGSGGSSGASGTQTAEVQTISAEQAHTRMESGDPVAVVDVRTAEEYAEAHIPGAILLPNEDIGDTAPEQLPVLDAEILIYCRSGNRSAQAAKKLVALGYTNVSDFGGMIDWPYETETGAWEEKAGTLASFRATTLDGKPVDESIFADNQLTMINIWATFCGPCLREMPELGELSESYQNRGVQIVGIVADAGVPGADSFMSQVELARQLVQQTGANYLHLLPSDDLIKAKLATVSSVPETIFVDSKGNLVGESYIGSRSGADWSQIIDTLLAQMGS